MIKKQTMGLASHCFSLRYFYTRIGCLVLFISFLCFYNGLAQHLPMQQHEIDSLKQIVSSMPADTNRVILLLTLSNIYTSQDPDKSKRYGNEALELSTDINVLADEYRRLSYHGIRAKDKNFNADYKMNLDPNLPLVNVIPQDIGRVFLNIFNNAFWACAERGRLELGNDRIKTEGVLETPPVFVPVVTLTTKKLSDQNIEIRISDNGSGIPPSIIDKIFQPFFTTKPPGQGTGLGLSLAYDIVKAHSGELKMVSEENIRTEFVITLPI